MQLHPHSHLNWIEHRLHIIIIISVIQLNSAIAADANRCRITTTATNRLID